MHKNKTIFFTVVGFFASVSFSAAQVPANPPLPPPPLSMPNTSVDVGVGVVKPEVMPIILIQNDLSIGMYSDEIHALQQILQGLGYFSVAQLPTGYFGVLTRRAVIEFQRSHNIPATGYVGPLTRGALNGDTPVYSGDEVITTNLWLGSRGGSVLVLQRKLQALGYFPDGEEPTGYFGSITRSAVVAYQQANGIPATGYVGPLTRAALGGPSIPPGKIEVLGNAELRYKILQRYPNIFFCDHDFYPVPRFEEIDLVRARFPEIKSNAEEFQAIVRTLGFGGKTVFSDEDKLALYREHKKLGAISSFVPGFEGPRGIYAFALTIGNETEGFLIHGTINDQGVINETERSKTFTACPICLSKDTRIDTPHGAVRVTDLQEGVAVWTTDASGTRVIGYVEKTSKTPVPPTHEVVHLTLSDGRELMVSPGHPTAEGKKLGAIETGEYLDGSLVLSVERVPYAGGFTYDLLPSGETGTYFANGILVGSTLR